MACARIRLLACVLGFLLMFVACSDHGSPPTSSLTIHRVSGTHVAAWGEGLTIYGEGLGTTPGTVSLQQDAYLVDCPIVYWADRAIAFQVPEGIEGLCDLLITSPVGDKKILNYANVKEDPEPGDFPGNQCSMDSNPTGVAYYDGKIWLFNLTKVDGPKYPIKYQTYDMAADKWSKGCFSLEVGGSECCGAGYDAKVAPVIVNNWLLVFWFNLDGTVDYAMFTGRDENGKDIWQWVPGTKPDVSGEKFPAPVYNPTTNRLELYYKSGGTIGCCYADVPDPQKDFQLNFQKAHPSTPLPASKYGPGAAMVQTGKDPQTGDSIYQTMLATVDDDKSIRIHYLDGNYNSTQSDMLDEKANDTPCLVNLENGLVALLWSGTSSFGDVIYYDWQNPTQGDHGWTDKESWKTALNFLTAVAAYEPVTPTDPNADPNYPDMEGKMYCFYTCMDNEVHWRIDRVLGTWRYKATTTADFSEGMLKDNKPGPTFAVCPLLGVVDAPPFVLNGGDAADNTTCLVLANESGEGSGCDVDLKAGPYVETGGEKKPFTMQVSAGATYANKTEFHQTMTIKNSNGAQDPPQILLVMVAPVLNFVEYVRYDTDGHEVPSDTFTMVTVQDANLYVQPLSMEYPDFDENFPNLHKHKAGCVNTYDQKITDDTLLFMSAGNTWHPAKDETITITFTTENTDMKTVGGYAKFKIGADIKEMFGLGIEGEFDMNWSNTTSVSTETELNLWNPPPRQGVDGDVDQFYVTAYWLKPKEDADWVPAYRQGSGDTPWFITYYVDSIGYQGGVVTPGCE